MKRLIYFLALLLSLATIGNSQNRRQPKLEGYIGPNGAFHSVLEMSFMLDSQSLIAKYLPMYAAAPDCVRKGQLYYNTGTDKMQLCTATGSPGTWSDVATGSGLAINASDGRIPYRSSATAFADSPLNRDDANTVSQINGSSAQTLKVFGSATAFLLLGGATPHMHIGTSSALNLVFNTNGAERWMVADVGHFLAVTDNTFDIGATNANRPRSIYPAAPSITVGSGTGITVGNSGEIRETVYKVTVASTAFICNAVTCDVTVATLPAKTQITGVIADLTTTFACASVCTTSTLSMVFGRGAGGAQWLASFDADAATAQFGDADAELGTTMTRAAAIQGSSFENWSGTQAAVLRLTSGTGNVGTGAATNLSQGSVTIYVRTAVMP